MEKTEISLFAMVCCQQATPADDGGTAIMRRMALIVLGLMAIGQCCLGASDATGEKLIFKDRFVAELAKKVPSILASQDKDTGRFGTGIWMVNDQHPIFPLAVAWATKHDDNPYYHDPEVLEAIIAGGDALIDDQAPDGQWLFRKKDGSTWGMTYMPWTYSRWVQTFGLIRNAMPFEKRQQWEQALKLGFTGIAKTQLTRPVNIPAHHAMGLYIAGQVFDNIEWRQKAKDFMAKVVAAQDPVGFWTEHNGPVVMYNYVYSGALGIYYAASRDQSVLPALEKAAQFHSAFVYPNATNVETIDERNPYSRSKPGGNVGFTFTPQGRGYLHHQWKSIKAFSPDIMAELVMYGQEGSVVETASERKDYQFVSSDNQSLIRRKAPWFICVSAYNCPVFESRWIQDRQNFVSVFHDRAGLIMGGGNTKMQPLWSNFTVGDTSLLQKKAGDDNPKFTPPDGLTHVPSNAVLQKSDPVGLTLDYDKEQCEISVEPVDDDTAIIRLKSTSNGNLPVAAHITLLPTVGKDLVTEHSTQTLGGDAFELSGEKLGGWIEHTNWRLTMPETASVKWPVLPHNPYTKDGFAETGEGRIVVSLPMSIENPEYSLTLTVKQPQPATAKNTEKEKK